MVPHTESGVFVRFSKMMENKNILIGVTGGIAAFKICELIRKFKKAGANVLVSGSYLFRTENLKQTADDLRKAVD